MTKRKTYRLGRWRRRAAAVLLVGCDEMTGTAQETRPTEARLVGAWQIEDYETGEADPNGTILTFNRDGTLVSTNAIEGATISAPGTWSLQGDVLTISVTVLGLTVRTEARITELTATRLCWRVEDAEEDTCYRRR